MCNRKIYRKSKFNLGGHDVFFGGNVPPVLTPLVVRVNGTPKL